LRAEKTLFLLIMRRKQNIFPKEVRTTDIARWWKMLIILKKMPLRRATAQGHDAKK